MHDALREITSLLETEIGCMRELTDQLVAEKEALLAARHEDLIPISDAKLKLAHRLAEVQDQRRALMKKIGGREGAPAKLIDLAPYIPKSQRGVFRQAVHTVADMAQRLTSMNQANHDFVNEALDTVEHMINMLSGAGQKSVAYSAAGVMSQTSRPRMVAREV